MKKLALSFAALTFLSGCAYVTPVSNTTDFSKVDFSNSYETRLGLFLFFAGIVAGNARSALYRSGAGCQFDKSQFC